MLSYHRVGVIYFRNRFRDPSVQAWCRLGIHTCGKEVKKTGFLEAGLQSRLMVALECKRPVRMAPCCLAKAVSLESLSLEKAMTQQ